MAISDINTLMEQAKCFRCLSHKELVAVQTYIIAYASGHGMDPGTLLGEAKCLLCLTQKNLFQIRAYLIAYIGGLSTDPQTLAGAAECYRCIPDGMMEAIRAYLFSLDPNGPGETSPEVLESDAAAFKGLTPEESLAIQVYLLALNAGVSTDPSDLYELAKCFNCLSFEVLNSITTNVVDEVEHDGGISGGGECVDVPADLIPVITANYTDGVASSLDILFPKVCCAPGGYWIYGISSGGQLQQGIIDASHAGEANYEVLGVDITGIADADGYFVRQYCEDLTESGNSNEVDADTTCGVATSVIEVTGAGEADANGFFEWDQAEYDSTGSFVYVNPDSDWYIEFVDGAGGVEAYLYDNAANVMYHLPLGECFPCGTWSNDGGDLGSLPVPNCEWSLSAEIAVQWGQRVVGNGGTRPSFTTLNAVSTFYDSLSPTLLGKLKAVNLFAPDSYIAAMTPFIKLWGSTVWNKVNNVSVGGGIVDAGIWGAEPDSNTGIYTSFNPSTHADCLVADFGCSIYTNHNDFFPGAFGGRSGSNYFAVYPAFLGTWYFDFPDNGGASRITATIPTRFRGFVSYNRSAANRADVWYANADTAFTSGGSNTNAVSNTKPNLVLYLGAFNEAGAWQAGGCRGYGFCAFHLALTATESEELYDAVELYRRNLGGGYVPSTAVASEVVTEMANNITFASGAAMSAGTRTALETFWNALVTANIQDKMLVVVPFVPDNLTAARTPLIGIGSARNLTNTGFVAGDLTANGLIGDAIGKYLNLVHFVPSRLFFSATDIGVTLYIHTGKNEASNDGACYSVGAAGGYSIQNFSNNMYSDTGEVATGRIGPIADAVATGYYSGNRIAANDHRLFKAKSTFAHAELGQNLTAAADIRSTVTVSMTLFSFNIVGGGAGGFSSKRISFWAAHLGLSSSESSAFYNAIQALRTALGGGFV